jgi:hypothetical protein
MIRVLPWKSVEDLVVPVEDREGEASHFLT